MAVSTRDLLALTVACLDVRARSYRNAMLCVVFLLLVPPVLAAFLGRQWLWAWQLIVPVVAAYLVLDQWRVNRWQRSLWQECASGIAIDLFFETALAHPKMPRATLSGMLAPLRVLESRKAARTAEQLATDLRRWQVRMIAVQVIGAVCLIATLTCLWRTVAHDAAEVWIVVGILAWIGARIWFRSASRGL